MTAEELAYDATRAEQLSFSLGRTHGLSRRELLKLGAAGLPLLAGFARPAAPRAARADNGSPISKPLPSQLFVNYGSNAEMRWDAVSGLGYTIPNDRFFVRDHTGTPIVDLPNWRLAVFGTGLKGSPSATSPVTFTLEALQALPAKTVYSFIECAGNGRSFFGTQQGTPAAGTQWGLGAVGVAAWTRRPALDGARPCADPARGPRRYARRPRRHRHGRRGRRGARAPPIPASKALAAALLAYEMNGAPLPYDHGAPLRLVVPGWVGVANIK